MINRGRDGVGSLAGYLLGYFFLITFAVYAVKPAKESLFLAYLGTRNLPYAFILTAVLMGLAVSVHARLLARLRRPTLISLTLLFFAASGSLLWLDIHRSPTWRWIYLVVYSWGDLLMAISITQFWILVNDLFNPREAKRRIGSFVGAGLLGGISGSLVARFRPGNLGTESLLIVAAAALAGVVPLILAARRAAGPRPQEDAGTKTEGSTEKVGFGASLALVRGNRYLLALSGMILTAIVASNLVHFQFQKVAEMFFPDKNARTSFLATFYVAILVVSYLLTAFVTSRVLKRFGLRFAQMILPGLLLAGALASFLPGINLIIWAIALKGTDKTLTHSLTQSLREVLYIPVPTNIKYKAKAFIDMFLNKFADGLTGFVLLAVSLFLRLTIAEVSVLIIGVVVLWVFLNLRVAREYVNIVKRNLEIKWHDADKLITDKIDVDLTKLVFDTLQSRERSSVLYAMNLFDLIKKENLSPEMKTIIGQKNSEIMAMSMASAFDAAGGGPVPGLDDDLDPDELDAAVREITSLDVYQQVMKTYIEKAAGQRGPESELSRMESAKVIGLMGAGARQAGNLKKLLADPSVEVLRYAAESAGRLRLRESVHRLVELLDGPATQAAAAGALAAYGGAIAGTLKDYLSDPGVSLRARRAIPDILANIGTQRAAEMLIMELRGDGLDVETEVIEALSKLRARDGSLEFPEREVLAKTCALVRTCHLIVLQIDEASRDKKKRGLVRELENGLARTMKHVFELLSLVYSRDDIMRAYQNIKVGTKKSLDYSVELLENILRKEIKDMLLPLLEDTSFEEKVRHSRRLARGDDDPGLT